MIFKSIRLCNFRQYKDDVTFDFSVPNKQNKNNITLLIAANGVGKTTMLQAFRYCFYGKSSNYLNLPKADELVNNTLAEDLRDLDEAKMFVEVAFVHEGKDYLARRETVFMKNKSILKETNEEKFSLSVLEDSVGYRPFKDSEASIKIRSILPEGLSQVFMFDGERMEKNISDRSFSNELKESILGILNIKKYDRLIDILGYEGKVTSVIGILASRKKTSSAADLKAKNDYDRLMEEKVGFIEKIDEIVQEIKETDRQININEEQQKKLDAIRERALEKKRIDDKIKSKENLLNNLAREYIKDSKYALLYKLLLVNKTKYDDFVNIGRNKNNFYSHLHINTINDIQDKGVCVCGRKVLDDSNEYHHLNELKKTSLPLESAQNLNIIDQKFRQCADYKELMNNLNQKREEIRHMKKDILDLTEEYHLISQDIAKVERELGLKNQSQIEELMQKKIKLYETKGSIEERKRLCEKGIERLISKINKIDNDSEYNQKINTIIEVVKRIKEKLEMTKNKKDEEARNVLSRNFNDILSKTIHGDYDVLLDSRYQMRIIDKGNNQDVTNALSTGQNVVISLTFVNALIQTAKELSNQINKDEKYGVIMDAALSNLDEAHIEKLCRNTINNMDQLIFLSFKRQLRDEMYQGIKDNVGKAFVINKHKAGHIFMSEIELNTLEEYIHYIEEEENAIPE